MIIVITGPTCTFKSKIAIEVAKCFNAEIVNADAFQIYQELDIGTAKPSEMDLKAVPHHLYSYIKPNERYSIYQYQKDARKVISNILKRNKNVILVGGSGLYIRAALYDYEFSENQNNINLTKFDNLTNEELHNELRKIDPIQANKIHQNNRKRVLRAIAIYLLNIETKSEIEDKQKHRIIYDDVYIYAVKMDKEKLYERINSRVDMMIEKGLVNEANILKEKYGENLQSLCAIGYKEIINNNSKNIDEITELIKKNTRHYAKRQITFAKHQYGDKVKWIESAKDIINDIKNNNKDSRSEALVGKENLEKIKKLTIAVVGIGGVGGTAFEALVRSGVNNLIIIDKDKVNASNLNRQVLFTNKDIHKSKVKVASIYAKKINVDCNIKDYEEFLDENNIESFSLDKCDYVIDAIDSTKSKLILIKYLLNKKIKFISSLGMGNRLDSSKVIITTLDKTHDDPLAKKLRNELKKDKIDIRKISVVTSVEVPLKNKEMITSMIYVPSVAGLLMANYIINKVVKE